MSAEGKVLIYGDSLVKYIPKEEKSYTITASGRLTIERFIDRLARGQYDRAIEGCRGVLIIIGTNNLSTSEPNAIIDGLGQIRAIINSKNREITVSIATIIPREDNYKEKAKLVSNKLLARGKAGGWKICQIHRTFIKKNKAKQSESLYRKDGLHLSETGNRLLRNYLLNYVDSHFK